MNILQKPLKYSFFNLTIILILINCTFFFFTSLFPILTLYLGLSLNGLKHGFIWQVFTHLFIHGSFSHLFLNMLALFIFGIPIEKKIGSFEFLLFYFLCGILDGLFSLIFYNLISKNAILIGASGVIYGLLLIYAVIFPLNKIYLWGIIPIVAPLLVGLYAVIELGSQIVGKDSIGHIAHLFGFVIAWLYLLIRFKLNPIKIWKIAYKK
jgi:membrane associated rhomboid family serine protease